MESISFSSALVMLSTLSFPGKHKNLGASYSQEEFKVREMRFWATYLL